jgi:hypothetical protein
LYRWSPSTTNNTAFTTLIVVLPAPTLTTNNNIATITTHNTLMLKHFPKAGFKVICRHCYE